MEFGKVEEARVRKLGLLLLGDPAGISGAWKALFVFGGRPLGVDGARVKKGTKGLASSSIFASFRKVRASVLTVGAWWLLDATLSAILLLLLKNTVWATKTTREAVGG